MAHNKNFHDKEFDKGTNRKLDLYRLYLRAWLPTFLNTQWTKSMQIFDFFAGPGTDVNGNVAQTYQTPMMAYPPNYYLPQQNGNSQNKTVMPPASSGVNIMIFNPSAAPPNGQGGICG